MRGVDAYQQVSILIGTDRCLYLLIMPIDRYQNRWVLIPIHSLQYQ